MSTGDQRVNTYSGKILTSPDFQSGIFENLKKYTADFIRSAFSENGGVFTPVTLSAGAADDQISVSEVEGFNSEAQFVAASPGWDSYLSDVDFPNNTGDTYRVYIRPSEIPASCESNQRTGEIAYKYYEESIGDVAEPNSVINNGDVNLTFEIQNPLIGGAVEEDFSGRSAFVWLKSPKSLTDFIEECTVNFSGGNCKITTVGLLGQGGTIPISTDVDDYQILFAGPTIVSGLALTNEWIFIGVFDGNGPGAAPTGFDYTDQRVFSVVETNYLNILQLARDLYTTPSLDGDGLPNLPTPIETIVTDHEGRITTNEGDIATNASNISTNAGNISTNAANIALLTVSPSVIGNIPSFLTVGGALADSGVAASSISQKVSPSVVGNLLSFSNTTGGLQDAGIAASQITTNAGNISTNAGNISKVLVSPAVSGNIPSFNGTDGTLQDSGVAASSISQKVSPSVVGNLPSFSNITGSLQDSGVAASQITTNASNISTNAGNIAANTSAIGTLSTTKADKVSGATSGNLAGLNASGNLIDSGYAPSNFSLALYDAVVDAAGGGDYTSITTACATEGANKTIFVRNGFYNESTIYLREGQCLVAESWGGVTIDANVRTLDEKDATFYANAATLLYNTSTVTLSSGTFPTPTLTDEVANRWWVYFPDRGLLLKVASRNSATQLTLTEVYKGQFSTGGIGNKDMFLLISDGSGISMLNGFNIQNGDVNLYQVVNTKFEFNRLNDCDFWVWNSFAVDIFIEHSMNSLGGVSLDTCHLSRIVVNSQSNMKYYSGFYYCSHCKYESRVYNGYGGFYYRDNTAYDGNNVLELGEVSDADISRSLTIFVARRDVFRIGELLNGNQGGVLVSGGASSTSYDLYFEIRRIVSQGVYDFAFSSSANISNVILQGGDYGKIICLASTGTFTNIVFGSILYDSLNGTSGIVKNNGYEY